MRSYRGKATVQADDTDPVKLVELHLLNLGTPGGIDRWEGTLTYGNNGIELVSLYNKATFSVQFPNGSTNIAHCKNWSHGGPMQILVDGQVEA